MQYLALEKISSAPLKYEKSEIDPNDAVMGDVISDERRKENAEFPFEHRDLHESKFFSSDLETSEPHKVQTLQPKPYKEDDAMNHLREDHSEMFVTDPESRKLNVTEEREDVNTDETEECLSKNNEEKASRGIFTVKGIFQKMVIWTLDEKLYTGVTHHGSFINRLSKVLTG